MKTLDLIQGSPEWLAHRRNHWNASDAPAMMGCSPYKTRSQLLHEMATGITPEVDASTQRRFDDGHRFEALARELAEEIVGEPLYPVTGTNDSPLYMAGGRAISASFDGLTLGEEIDFEHKALNAELRAIHHFVGQALPLYHRVQMEQQMMVSGAKRVLFMASKWEGDALVEERHCWYEGDDALRGQIIAGWAQFAADLAAYIPPEVLDRVAPVGHRPDQLPALRAQASGALVLESNIKEWEAAALDYIKSVRDHELKTDEDFANADAAAKWCDTSKETLLGVRSNLMSATGDVNTAVATLDRIAAELDKTRIAFTNAIKARKDARKLEIVKAGEAALKAHIDALNIRLGKPYMPVIPADFAGVVRGLKSLDSMQSKVSDELARAKILANEAADRIDANLKHLREHAADYKGLFPDTAQIVLKASEDLQALVTARISEHKAAQIQVNLNNLAAYKPSATESSAWHTERINALNTEPLTADLYGARLEEARSVKAKALEALETSSQAATQREAMDKLEAFRKGNAPAVVELPSNFVPATNVAPAANVVPMTRPVAITRGPSVPAISYPALTIGVIKERLAPAGLSTDTAGLALLGFHPAETRGNGKFFHEHDWPLMLAAMVAGLEAIQAKQAA